MDVGMSVSSECVCVCVMLIGSVQKCFNRSVLSEIYGRLKKAANNSGIMMCRVDDFLHKATTIDLLRPNGDVSCAS